MTVSLPFIRLIGIVCFLPLVAPGGGAARNAPAWTDTGPAFSAGTLGNSGQNLYVNRRGELETIRRYDLDANGYLDLLFNSSHDSCHYVPATVVTAGPGPTLHTAEFGVDGSSRVISADLNRDGFTDLVFMPNRQNVQRNRSSLSIAWGGPDGWSSAHLTRLRPRLQAGPGRRRIDREDRAWRARAARSLSCQQFQFVSRLATPHTRNIHRFGKSTSVLSLPPCQPSSAPDRESPRLIRPPPDPAGPA